MQMAGFSQKLKKRDLARRKPLFQDQPKIDVEYANIYIEP